jgi:hypothetical protein
MKTTRLKFIQTMASLLYLPKQAKAGQSQTVYPTVPQRLPSASLDTSALLRAISEVESNGNDSAVGLRGERSKFQIMESTWYDYSNLNFRTNCRGLVALLVAEKHLEFLKRSLGSNPYWLAIGWNSGVNSARYFQDASHTSLSHKYAQRVVNLYNEYKTK